MANNSTSSNPKVMVSSFTTGNRATETTSFRTVGDALTSGIDYVTKPFFSDGVGAATRFKNFVSDTAAKFSAPEQTLTPEQVTAQAKESSKAVIEAKDAPAGGRTDQVRAEQVKQKQITAERKASSQKVLDDTKPDTTVTTGAKDVADAAKPDKESLYDRYVSMKEGVADRPIPGTGVSIGEAASVSKDATLVYGTYQYFNPDEVSGEFYNPNVGLANALNTPNDPYTMSSQASSFVPVGQANQTLFDAGKIYANAMGMTGPDPILESLNAPGYGFLLEIAKPYVLEGAVPGQSLTNAPDQPYPWEGPPEITSQKEAINRIFLDIIKPGNIEVLSDLMANDIPIANIAEMLIKTGFQKGKYNPDLAITLMEPTMFMLLSVAEKVGIEPKLSDDDDEDEIGDEEEVDTKGNMRVAQRLNPAKEEPKSLRDLKPSMRTVPMAKPDIQEQLDNLDTSKLRESILQKKRPKASNSLLGKEGE